MKILVLLLFALLSACTTLQQQSQTASYSISIPNAWSIQGRLSITSNGKTEIANFEFTRKEQYQQLTLTGSFGFGQLKIEQTPLGLLVDNKSSTLSLQEWMQFKLGWFFPIDTLEHVVFKPSFNNPQEDWQIKVSKYQAINTISYPKIIYLSDLNKGIKIKLLLREIHRLK